MATTARIIADGWENGFTHRIAKSPLNFPAVEAKACCAPKFYWYRLRDEHTEGKQ